MVDNFVNAVIGAGKPVIYGSQMSEDAAENTGFLADFTNCGLLGRLGTFEVPLWADTTAARRGYAARSRLRRHCRDTPIR